MPTPPQFTVHFEEQKFYHVICKSIGNQLIFFDDNDRYDFLKKYQRFLGEFVDTFSYNLLDNHVHWVLKMKSETEIFSLLTTFHKKDLTITQKKYLGGECTFHEVIKQQFSRFFISYTRTFNTIHNRKGHLFNRPFTRINVDDEGHLIRLFVYVHANTLKHGFFKDFVNYKWSSYQLIIGNTKTFVCKERVLTLFDGTKKFINIHLSMSEIYEKHELSGE
jgi:putative transposase